MKTAKRISTVRKPRKAEVMRDWHNDSPHAPEFYVGPKDECFEETERLSKFQVREWMGQVMIEPKEIIPVLKKAKIDFVVMGLYGISAWLKESRATNDFDVLVPKRQTKAAVRALCEAFPFLKARDTEVVVRLEQGEAALIDVMKPHHKVFNAVLKNFREQTVAGFKVKVPDVEMALVLKFFAMTSPYREQEKSFQDAHDFILIVKNNRALDLEKLKALGELVFDGAGAKLIAKIDDVRSGRRLEL